MCVALGYRATSSVPFCHIIGLCTDFDLTKSVRKLNILRALGEEYWK